MVIGRENEIKKLKKYLSSNESELIAVYGRRRVGKTFLVREVYKKQIVFELTGLDKGRLKKQLKNFHEQLKTTSKKRKNTTSPKDWFDAFALLRNYLDDLKGKDKKVIFIDEFPWIDTQRSDFLTLFGHFWNTYCTKRNDLIVVVCGSAASFMVKKIIKNKGGLHGRLSDTIQLLPFNLCETELYLKSRNINLGYYDILQLYMVVGGVPFYLSKIEKGLSVAQNIDRLCFEKGGALVNEFDEVLISLFTNSHLHQLIIETLSTNKKGISRTELIKKCKTGSSGNFSRALEELTESGFVAKYEAIGRSLYRTLYRLSDEYCYFYLKFIKRHQGQGAGTWLTLFPQQTYKSWSGFAFETICLKHVQQIKKALGIDRIHSINSSWFNKHAQVDLVIDRKDSRINLCEMKFYSGLCNITKKYEDELRNKVNEFVAETKTRKNVVITMVTTFGLKVNSQSISIVEDDLKMDMLFANA